MLLREFLEHLVEVTQLSQSAIARRCHLSQAVINKILVGNSMREPAASTYKAIAKTWPEVWSAWLEANPSHAQNLADQYGWAVATRTPGTLGDRHQAIQSQLDATRRQLEALIKDAGAVSAKPPRRSRHHA